MTEVLPARPTTETNTPTSSSKPDQLPTPVDSPVALAATSSLKDVDEISPLGSSIDRRLGPDYGFSNPLDGGSQQIVVSKGNTDYEFTEGGRRRTAVKERKRSIGKIGSPSSPTAEHFDKVLKLSPNQIQELTTEPSSIPVRAATPILEDESQPVTLNPRHALHSAQRPTSANRRHSAQDTPHNRPTLSETKRRASAQNASSGRGDEDELGVKPLPEVARISRPDMPQRTFSTPTFGRRKRSQSRSQPLQETQGHARVNRQGPAPLSLKDTKTSAPNSSALLRPSPIPESGPSPRIPLPLPPLSLHTFLELELAADGPSPLYIHRASSADRQYESTDVVFERLRNFIALPNRLEQVLWFGAIACLDAWLYTFTILPLRFFKALRILLVWSIRNAWKEVYDLVEFVYRGSGRVWTRQMSVAADGGATPTSVEARSRRGSDVSIIQPLRHPERERELHGVVHAWPEMPKRQKKAFQKHRRTRSTPSLLQPSHKADLLKGLLVVLSCVILMRMDPSRMYHNIRGQAAIKLYVIYNVLEVGDRMLSAIGQDILEALFSRECLERDTDGRSKVIRPLWVFLMALAYNVAHAAALFYQVITLNVAVNSYSNALLTLLMSNQFVEIKGTVFKKFEKENLFQLTCADVVERFQLWLMLLIIAMRNIVEVGGLNISISSSVPTATPTPGPGVNTTSIPISGSMIPRSFRMLPNWTGDVLAPFLIVLGSEMAVDWVKHCFIAKFNNVKPNIYGRFFDVLAKDYYIHAFADQDLTKRLGLPVLPLACLFIRASIQTYHMFLATHMPLPLASPATALVVENATTTPATKAALAHIDDLFRRALGRGSFDPTTAPLPGSSFWAQHSLDDFLAWAMLLVVVLICFLLLLCAKLVLGMLLLSLSRKRYKTMKERANIKAETNAKRYGGWGCVEVEEEKRRWIYKDDPDALERLREKEAKAARDRDDVGKALADAEKMEKVRRYDMVAKRIW